MASGDGDPCDGAAYGRDDAVRLNGFRRATLDSKGGTGGASCARSFPVLNAFLIDAKDDLRVGVECVVACPEELDFGGLKDEGGLPCPKDDDSDAKESPRVWNDSGRPLFNSQFCCNTLVELFEGEDEKGCWPN